MTVTEKLVSFRNNRGEVLRGVLHLPRSHLPRSKGSADYNTAVVVLHGWPATLEGTSERLCRSLSRRGFLSVRFSFTGSPPSDGKFEDKLMSQEVKDIRSAINFLSAHYSYQRLLLIGHSTGAIDAALYAHTDRRISGLVLSGGVFKLDEAVRYDFTDRMVRDFWTKGFTYRLPPGSDKRKRIYPIPNRGKIRKAFYDEFFTLDIPGALKKYRRPLLVIHGENDEAVPANKEPRAIFEHANKPKRLVIIPGAGHSYKAPRHHAQAIRAIQNFAEDLPRRR